MTRNEKILNEINEGIKKASQFYHFVRDYEQEHQRKT